MKVKVIHHSLGSDTDNTLVASVTVEKFTDPYDALEFAFFRTQNIEDSWSNPQRNGEPNKDGGKEVKVEAPLFCDDDGKTYGLRSSMVGDYFQVENDFYICKAFGFKPCDPVNYNPNPSEVI